PRLTEQLTNPPTGVVPRRASREENSRVSNSHRSVRCDSFRDLFFRRGPRLALRVHPYSRVAATSSPKLSAANPQPHSPRAVEIAPAVFPQSAPDGPPPPAGRFFLRTKKPREPKPLDPRGSTLKSVDNQFRAVELEVQGVAFLVHDFWVQRV